LSLASRPIRLPLCDATAEALACAILQGDQQQAQSGLASTMALDPALALWCALKFDSTSSNRHDSLPTIQELAAWLHNGLPDCLIASECDTDAPSAADEPHAFDPEALLDWATTSVAVARSSASTASTPDTAKTDQGDAPALESILADPAYTGGLLRNAGDWVGQEHVAAIAERLSLADLEASGDPECEPLPLDLESQLAEHWTGTSQLAECLYPLANRLRRAETIESRFEDQLQQEKLQALYTLAAGAGHEINNPLGSIAGRAQLLMRDESDPHRRRTLAKINSQAFRAHEMISDMMLFARPPRPVPSEVDVASLASEVVTELHENATDRSTVLTFHPPSEPVFVTADRSQIAVALRAICTNSLEALGGGGGHVEVTVRNVELAGLGNSAAIPSVQIEVRDDGPGIDTQFHSQLFDPFYSGREAGRGLGFGLSKCWRIVTNHGGTISIDSSPGRGATLTMTFPVESNGRDDRLR